MSSVEKVHGKTTKAVLVGAISTSVFFGALVYGAAPAKPLQVAGLPVT